MVFHLAIPSRDLNESAAFYNSLGAKIGRRYLTHIVINFFGHQLVCHKALDQEQYAQYPSMYPRHFGVILDTEEDLRFHWRQFSTKPFVFEPYFERQVGKPEEHHTFFLKDPSNNLIEFKWYRNLESLF